MMRKGLFLFLFLFQSFVWADCIASPPVKTCPTTALPLDEALLLSIQPDNHLYFQVPWTSNITARPEYVDSICVFVQSCAPWPYDSLLTGFAIGQQPFPSQILSPFRQYPYYEPQSIICQDAPKSIVCHFENGPFNITSHLQPINGTGRLPWDTPEIIYPAIYFPATKLPLYHNFKIIASIASQNPCLRPEPPISCQSPDPKINPSFRVCTYKPILKEDLCGPIRKSDYFWDTFVLSVETNSSTWHPSFFDFRNFTNDLSIFLSLTSSFIDIITWETIKGDNLLKVELHLGGLSKVDVDSYLAKIRSASSATLFSGMKYVDFRRGVLKEERYEIALVIVVLFSLALLAVGVMIALILYRRRVIAARMAMPEDDSAALLHGKSK